MSPLDHDAVAALLGAYALDAVDGPAERAAIEEHLGSCPRCREELRAHMEVAGVLGDTGSTAPPGVWDRIAAEIHDGSGAPPLPPLDLAAVRAERGSPERADAALPPARRRPRARVVGAAAAALALAGLGSMGFVIAQQQARLDEMEADMDEAMAPVLTDPDAAVVQLVDAEGVVYASAVVGDDGRAVLVSTSLGALPDDRTYQLWAVGADGPVSLGMLGAAPTVVPFRIAGEMPMTLAITDEPASGSVEPTTEPMVTGELADL